MQDTLPISRHLRSVMRKGNIVVLAAAMMVVMLGLVAFAVDIGYLMLARTELQRSADAGALAATWELINDQPLAQRLLDARLKASEFVALNKVCSEHPQVAMNLANAPTGDVVIGTLARFPALHEEMTFADPRQFNSVRVRIRRDGALNNRVPYFFAGVLGLDGAALQADATAAIITNVSGFRAPQSDESPIPMLPITLHIDTWNDLLSGAATADSWAWDPESGSVQAGPDGHPEAMLYPERNGSSGNFGTVNIGTSANATSHLSDQILHGLSESDLNYHGGELKLGSDGTLSLSGDTGISASIKDELAAIRGEPRIIPVYQQVAGSGDNAVYTIVKFVGIRVMEVRLTGGNKRLLIQPANVVTGNVIPGQNSTSDFVFSPAHLIK